MARYGGARRGKARRGKARFLTTKGANMEHERLRGLVDELDGYCDYGEMITKYDLCEMMGLDWPEEQGLSYEDGKQRQLVYMAHFAEVRRAMCEDKKKVFATIYGEQRYIVVEPAQQAERALENLISKQKKELKRAAMEAINVDEDKLDNGAKVTTQKIQGIIDSMMSEQITPRKMDVESLWKKYRG